MKKRAIYLNKFVIISISSIILLMSLFIILAFFYIERTGTEIGKAHQTEMCSQVLTEAEAELSKMYDVSSILMNDSRLVSCFSELSMDMNSENDFDTNLLSNVKYSSILSATNSTKPPIWRICIYNDRGDFISTGAVCETPVVKNHLAETDVYTAMQRYRYINSNFDLLMYDNDVWSNTFHSRYVVLRRPLMNIYSNNVYGIIELSLDTSSFENILSSYADNGIELSLGSTTDKTIAKAGVSEGKLIETKKTSANFPMEIVIRQSASRMMQPYRFLLIYVVLGAVILTFAACFVIFTVAVRLSRPLLELKKTVSGISFVNQTVGSRSKTDEIKELDSAFSDMLNRLNNSLMLEKKASMLAMQSQMNPHFLFNTLSVIGATGTEDGSERVQLLCSQLCSMLRYAASYENSMVTVEDEVQNLKDYLKLMKARYEDFLSYDINVSDEAKKLAIPKMILQPLVENSFTHGFVNREPPYYVSVDITLDNYDGKSFMKIVITDNGCGFTDKEKEYFVDRVKRLENGVSENMSSTSIGGLGLASAVLRMKLMTGKNVNLDIKNSDRGGAAIIITEEL